MSPSGTPPRRIIVVRRRVSHDDDHHGGSWKVAYADFVTAMMAFFLVMWILGMDPDVKGLVQEYFSNPVGFQQAYAEGRILGAEGVGPVPLGARHDPTFEVEDQRAWFERTASAIADRLQGASAFSGLDAQVDVVVTEQGLRIEIMDTGSQEALFQSGSSVLRPGLRAILATISEELAALPNDIVVEGHTDARPYAAAGYSNWELSVDRANAARRALLLSPALDERRFVEVRGHAARKPRVADDSLDPRNRRITILLPFAMGPDLRPLTGIGIFPASPATSH